MIAFRDARESAADRRHVPDGSLTDGTYVLELLHGELLLRRFDPVPRGHPNLVAPRAAEKTSNDGTPRWWRLFRADPED